MKDEKGTGPSPAEEACFEAGIKLGALFHQYIGSPVNPSSVRSLEEAMKRGVMCQPFVKDARVSIDREQLRDSLSDFGYASLSERMLRAEVTVEVRGAVVKGSLYWVDETGYPLMSVKEVRR
ncbi:MAG: dihydroneopterin aldolase family protein [Thermoplasmatota archaeon]